MNFFLFYVMWCAIVCGACFHLATLCLQTLIFQLHPSVQLHHFRTRLRIIFIFCRLLFTAFALIAYNTYISPSFMLKTDRFDVEVHEITIQLQQWECLPTRAIGYWPLQHGFDVPCAVWDIAERFCGHRRGPGLASTARKENNQMSISVVKSAWRWLAWLCRYITLSVGRACYMVYLRISAQYAKLSQWLRFMLRNCKI